MRGALTLVFCVVSIGLLASPAHASGPLPPVGAPWPFAQLPAGVGVSPGAAERIADRTAVTRRLRAAHPGIRPRVFFKREPKGRGVWEVTYPGHRNELAEVDVDGRSGRVIATWTGWLANYRLARGHMGAAANSWWIWLPLCLVFVLAFFDFRRPLRMLHLDLLALLGFGVSQLFYNHGRVLVSVPLVIPVLAYLLVRMLWLGFGGGRGSGPLVPHARTSWLVVGLVILVAFRAFVNVHTDTVSDIGEGGVLGAGAIEHNRPIYVGDRLHRDTYGPLNYVAYVPFVLVSPSSLWLQSRPAAHMASIFFDLLVLLALFLAGRRLRAGPEGTKLGVALAFAWAAYPYTLFALALNTNDALVAALMLLAFVALRSPRPRGVLLGAGIAAKFAPLALVPLFAAGTGDRRPRPVAAFAAGLAATVVLLFAHYMPSSGISGLWDLTVGYQLHRVTPFSVWTLYPSLHRLKLALELGVVALALAVAVVPRRRSGAQVAALSAAVLIAVQLLGSYWFYFYVVWFAGFVLIASFAQHLDEEPPSAGPVARASRAAAAARARRPAPPAPTPRPSPGRGGRGRAAR